MTTSTTIAKPVSEVAAATVAAPAPKAVTAAKPKTARAPKAATVKADAKPAKPATEKKATKGAPKAATASIAFTLMQRPASGAKLYAFTDAVLRLSGMANGKAVKKSVLTSIIGATAVRYHLTSTMAFTLTDKGDVKLSAGGKEFFATRAGKFSTDDAEKYAAILLTGKPNDLCKSANMINKVAA